MEIYQEWPGPSILRRTEPKKNCWKSLHKGVSTEFEVIEGLTFMSSLHGMTTGKTLFKEVEKTLVH